MKQAGIVFNSQFIRFQFSIKSFAKNFSGRELQGRLIRNSIAVNNVTDTKLRIYIEFGFVLAVYAIRASMIISTTTDVLNESDISISG